MARRLPAYAVALVLLAGPSPAPADGWRRVADRDGVVIESRTVEGTSLREVRATAHDLLPPAQIMATLWRYDEYPQFVPHVEHVEVLQDTGDSKLVYERIRMPVVKNRDTTVRLVRTFDAATGVYEVTGTAVPDEGPAPTSAYVRVRTSHSTWRLVPAANGGTDVTYDIRTDAGGLVPAWIVAGVQKDVAAKFVRAILDRARQAGP